MASLMASETLLLRNPNPRITNLTSKLGFRPNHLSYSSRSNQVSISKLTIKPQSLPKFRVWAFSSSPSPLLSSNNNNPSSSNVLSDSTRSIATLLGIALSISKLVALAIKGVCVKLKGVCLTPTPEELASIQSLQETLVCTVGPLFFAAVRSRAPGSLNTPLTVVASGMAKWLDIYSGVLMVRVLLSWFPNIPWDRQPLSAIRDLCDPYLNLFRNIIPPIFDTLDVSPILAFSVLGALGSILHSST
ncbi:hypothetical protein GIB67_032946 [Kingdonia uniflora]|uniref:Uncharacterized protein n=1 Tax=Kingdonia uniflora TaxID=39325 RepID=A0A7J7MYL9_9MAGN|nr:hypothetical protein GIB67_032946 [Kingdonia uniflora]